MPDCGGCTMCCKLMGVPELKKPAGTWCQQCSIGKGCNIYAERPTSCVEFECLYRAAPKDLPLLSGALSLRPDKCKVVLAPTTDPNIIGAFVDPGYPDAWKKQPVVGVLETLVKGGVKVVINNKRPDNKMLVLTPMPLGGIAHKTVQMTPPDENGMQWYEPKGPHE